MRCVWDGRKAELNARKHGVTFEEAATVFSDPLAVILEDESHPENARIIGESIAARILLVVFVERDRDVLRLISARRATRHERRRYEEGE
ncbi:MAG TPA: BrnT family toxin [Vicinamibacteria bacterium]|nr:BrnT family toxin [Vicinamibacteria bacterium]